MQNMDLLKEFFAIVISCVLLMCILSRTRFLYLTTKIRGPSLWTFLTVHAKHIFSDNMHTYIANLCECFGHKPWGMWFYSDFVTVVSDCKSVSELSSSRSAHIFSEKPGRFYKNVAKYLGNGLVTFSESQDCCFHLKAIQPALQKNLLEAKMPRINENAENLVKLLREKAADEKSFNVCPLIESQSTELAMWLFASGKYIYENNHFLCKTTREAMALAQWRSVHPVGYWLVRRFRTSFRKTESAMKKLIRELRNAFLEAKSRCTKEIQKNVNRPKDILGFMIEQNLKSKETGFDDEAIFAESRNLVFAAYETTAFTINVCLLLLALNPEIQEQVSVELESIFGRTNRAVDPEDLSRMLYLEMVIQETLRLFPPIPLATRKVTEEVKLNGVLMPKGSVLMVNIMALHRNAENFDDPLKFIPDRFRPENCKRLHPFAYIPFSFGSRMCPGQHQGIIVVKTMLCCILKNFKVLPGDGLNCVEDIKTKMAAVSQLSESSLRFVCRKKNQN